MIQTILQHLQFNLTTLLMMESGNYSITLTVESTVPAVEDIDLQYEVGKDGDSAVALKLLDPARDGDDYGVATPTDLSILSGTSRATITIPIETNVVDEPRSNLSLHGL